MEFTTYIVKGYTERNPDFTYEIEAITDTLVGDELRTEIMGQLWPECTWYEALDGLDAYHLSADEEQTHLSDRPGQRVYVFSVTDSDESETGEGIFDTFMITVEAK